MRPGEILYEYRIEKVLGQGGFGITYLAVDRRTQEKVVIKENIPGVDAVRNEGERSFSHARTVGGSIGVGSEEWARNNFIREARNLARLDHPCVVKVLGAYESTEMHSQYYVMPYVESVSLEEAMNRGMSPTSEWLNYMLCCMLNTLTYIHNQGVLHRDIKPANILIKKDGSPVLIDFGSARAVDRGTNTRIVSEDYAPIEQMRGEGEGAWTDLYSLGATLYHVITGTCLPRLALRVSDPRAYHPLVHREELVDLYGRHVLETIDHALELEPTARWQSATAWAQELEGTSDFQAERPVPLPMHGARVNADTHVIQLGAAKEAEQVAASAPSLPKQKTGNVLRSRKPLLLLTIALLCGLVGLLLYLLATGNSREAKPLQTTVQIDRSVSVPPEEESGGNEVTDQPQRPQPQPQPQPPAAPKRVIAHPGAVLVSMDGESNEEPTSFGVYFVKGEQDHAWLVSKKRDAEKDEYYYLDKSKAYAWNSNLGVRFGQKRNETELRTLYFDTEEHARGYMTLDDVTKGELIADIRKARAERKGSRYDLTGGMEKHGIIGVEPEIQGEYVLPCLEYSRKPVKQGNKETHLYEVAAMRAHYREDAKSGPRPRGKGDEVSNNEPVPVDVVFVLDTTSSMKPEIEDIKRVMDKMVDRLKSEFQTSPIRFGLVCYRDWKKKSGKKEPEAADGYITEVACPLSPAEELKQKLADVKVSRSDADYHEDVLAGLDCALHDKKVGWEKGNAKGNAVRWLILIGDAPGRGMSHFGKDEAHYLKSGREGDELALGDTTETEWKNRSRGSIVDQKKILEELKGTYGEHVYQVDAYFVHNEAVPKNRYKRKDQKYDTYVDKFYQYKVGGAAQFEALAKETGGAYTYLAHSDQELDSEGMKIMQGKLQTVGLLPKDGKIGQLKDELSGRMIKMIDEIKDPEKLARDLHADAIHGVFTNAYVDWASRQSDSSSGEPEHRVAWMADRSSAPGNVTETRKERQNLTPCVFMTRKERDQLVQDVHARYARYKKESEENEDVKKLGEDAIGDIKNLFASIIMSYPKTMQEIGEEMEEGKKATGNETMSDLLALLDKENSHLSTPSIRGGAKRAGGTNSNTIDDIERKMDNLSNDDNLTIISVDHDSTHDLLIVPIKYLP